MPQFSEFPALKNDRFLRALRRQPVDRTPVWIMRQAGRYLPEYRATRAEAGSFMDLCTNPERACEVTLQPLRRFELDAAILFSDILTIPDAMGLGLYFAEGEGPKFHKPVRTAADVAQLSMVNSERDLSYVMQAVTTIRHALAGSVPLIGFSGSPWTLATYMVEGQSTRDFKRIKSMLYGQPDVMHQLLSVLADSVVDYLRAQVRAGAQALQIFDTWGGVLSHDAYQKFSLAYMQRIVDALQQTNPDVPIILFTKNGGLWLEQIADTGCACVGLDWTMDISAARQRVGDRVALQGNLDPAILLTSPEKIRAKTHAVLDAFGPHPGHVFNLGHGITPDVPPEHVSALVSAIHEKTAN